MDEPERKCRGPFHWLAGKSRRFRIVVAIAAPLLYVASFGPACWWLSDVGVKRNGRREWSVFYIAPDFYWPIGWLAENCPEPMPAAIRWYATLGVDWVFVPTDWSNRKCVELWGQSPPVSVVTPSHRPTPRSTKRR